MQIVLLQTLRYAVDVFKCILQFFTFGGFFTELIFIFLRHQQEAVMPQESWVLSSSAPSVVQIRQALC